ncbi:glycine betaine ABC transporter substrate-binding protein [Dethiobacter alkaliphilus]|uniref:glycine betaine ABC transporter substrate-binding protein n=1 Tax=Dethiobacter alkaliphilus TaxID=427926 RepID=UPI002227D961|nr:glycine betaine ABC transporter substrate-binding protein [Dethiobacter alkaliphilus]MCW3490881.1 glycine betaine ABC transporter substrate-binding protein [Dethiobacter alkaliphilus]
MLKKRTILALIVVLTLALVVTGCGDNNNDANNENNGDVEAQTEFDLAYVLWDCATANSYMVKNVLEEEFDVTVNLRDMEAGFMWQGIADGDLDFMVTAWLPGTHASYYEQLQDDVDDLGPLYTGAAIGLVVPSYVEIDSIEELNDHADQFNGQIVGIDAGAGIMSATNDAIAEYDLDLSLLESSDAAMTAELDTAISNGEWIVVTGWAPHWKFGTYDLKFLEDPKGIYGGEETINVIAREGLADAAPEVHAFLDNYSMTADEFGSLIDIMQEYDDNDEAAQVWIEENRDLVDSWLQ